MDKDILEKSSSQFHTYSDLVEQQLLMPVEEILTKSGKRIRAKMVKAGFFFGHTPIEHTPNETTEQNLNILGEIIETIHAGSLIIDDIQDKSELRRGEPALYKFLGEPLAINAGNFLYFWPMTWLEQSSMSDSQQLEILRLYHRTLTAAHCGQAIDLGVSIDKIETSEVFPTCMKSLELKTGELMALSMGFGAIASGASKQRVDLLLEFGQRFGVSLQMFDDLGNLLNESDPKHLEDLILRRPSFIWAAAASLTSAEQYREFKMAVKALGTMEARGDTQLLWDWIEKTQFIIRAKRRARDFADEAMRILRKDIRLGAEYKRAFEIVHNLRERIENAYE